jgi:hypothetical protein
MPLAKIEIRRSWSPEQVQAIIEDIYLSQREALKVPEGMNGHALFNIERFQYSSQGPLDGGFGPWSYGRWAFLATATKSGEYPVGISTQFPLVAQCIHGGFQ